MNRELTVARFRELAQAYGGSLELWPAEERTAAAALLRSSSEAQSLVAAEAELDRVLAEAHEPEPSAAFMRRLNEVPVRVAQRHVWWPFGRWWIPAVGGVFAAALGLGWGLEATPFEEAELATTSALTVDAPVAEGPTASVDDDVSALARGTLIELQE